MRGLTGVQQRIGWTRGEAGVIGILAAGLLAGALIRLGRAPGDGAPDAAAPFDYAASDSTFRALADTAERNAPAAPHRTGAPRRKPHPPSCAIDINTAPLADLVRLPGIGTATASRIIEARERGGAFSSVDDLRRVKGIGAKKLAALRPYVTVR
ncbi:MAG TPA: ComEA family DNA-binding protein [Bacteroidota bacterium]|nr:ComEA family DNA-binding protein [Bacteroidota bacterium]